MRKFIPFAIIFLAACSPKSGLVPSMQAQAAHPRIWLDSATMTRLTTLKNANDATWLNMKADADAYNSATVEVYSQGGCSDSDICFTYQGEGWLDPLIKLSLAYKMTGTASYCTKAIAIMDAANTAGLPPEQVDTGYPSRSLVVGLAIAYDWCYDQLTAGEKTNYTALVDTWWTWVQAHGYQWDCSSGECKDPYGNYFGGHLLGFGLAALAMEGDDANMVTIQTAVLNAFNTYVVPAMSLTGYSTTWTGPFSQINIPGAGISGGFAFEGYNYGPNNFLRLIRYMKAMQTAGKTDLFTNNLTWIKQVAKNTIYEIRPDLWSTTDEGDWPGAYPRVLYRYLPYDLSGFLVGTTEGGWMQQLYNNMVVPASGAPASVYAPNTWELFLYNQNTTPVDYTASQSVYFYSPGLDQHTIVRTDWTTSAVHTTFNGDTLTAVADHQMRSSGHISIQRGSDYLLINSGQWQGTTGNNGTPGSDIDTGWHTNTLNYWDGGTSCLGNNDQYTGCQMFWGLTNNTTIKHKEGTGFAFQEAPLQNAYLNNVGAETITGYTRSFINIKDVDFIFDRITAPSTSTRKLEWHTPALNSASPAGIATAMSLAGALGTVTVGGSKLWIDTLLPTSPTITQITDKDGHDPASGTNLTAQRFEVVDPAAGSCSTNCLFLTVLAPTASGASAPTFTLLSPTNYKGALYDDGVTPRVAIFSSDGTAHNTVTYTASYSAGLTGQHVVTDLASGTYSVVRDGSTILSGQVVYSDGGLSFAATGGTSFTISQLASTFGSLVAPGIKLAAGTAMQ